MTPLNEISSKVVDMDENEAYDSASDEDFNPEAAAEEEAESSASEDDVTPNHAAANLKTGRKRDHGKLEEELDSGDEVTIQQRKRAKKHKRKGASEGDEPEVVVFSDDEGGEGGLIKTRAQRRVEKVERRVKTPSGTATINVESIWDRLKSAPIGRETTPEPAKIDSTKAAGDDDEYITIKRTYRFAGEVQTEEKRVLKSSKEAKLYLEQQARKTSTEDAEKENEGIVNDAQSAETATDAPLPVRRPLRRPSRFDPNPSGYVKTLPPEHQLTWPRKSGDVIVKTAGGKPPPRVRFADVAKQPEKYNTVDKSRMDWAGYVDKEGIAEELDAYGKAKDGYMGRMDFLQRVEAQQEGDRRDARLSGAAANTKTNTLDGA